MLRNNWGAFVAPAILSPVGCRSAKNTGDKIRRRYLPIIGDAHKASTHSRIQRHSRRPAHEVVSPGVGWDREDIDVLDYASLRAKTGAPFTPTPSSIASRSTTWMAPKTAPDRPRPQCRFRRRVGRAHQEMGVPLVHYSTNYVFDGVQGEYTEAGTPAPLSVYGRSKLRGEQMAAAIAPGVTWSAPR